MGIFHKLRCRLFGKKKKPIIYNYEEAARLDSLLLELRENRPRSTYDRHTYYINLMGKRCLIPVTRDADNDINHVVVTDIGIGFLFRGGFSEELRQRERDEERWLLWHKQVRKDLRAEYIAIASFCVSLLSLLLSSNLLRFQ